MDILSDVNVVGNLSVSGSIGSPGHPNTFKMTGDTLNVSEFANFKFGIGVSGQNGIDLDVTGAGKFVNFAYTRVCGNDYEIDVGKKFRSVNFNNVSMTTLSVNNVCFYGEVNFGNVAKINVCGDTGNTFYADTTFCADTTFYNNPTRMSNKYSSEYRIPLEISNFKAFPEMFLIKVPENCSKFLIKEYSIKTSDGTDFSILPEFLIRPLVNSYSGVLGTKRVDMDVEISVTSEIGHYRESVLGVITPFSSVSNLFVSVSDSIM